MKKSRIFGRCFKNSAGRDEGFKSYWTTVLLKNVALKNKLSALNPSSEATVYLSIISTSVMTAPSCFPSAVR
jgi:hypothetical protein